MPLILLDQNAPVGLRNRLPGNEVRTAFRMGWAELENGDMIAAAEGAGFFAMITGDRRIRYQQNLTGRRLALLELDTNRWVTIKDHLQLVIATLTALQPGDYAQVQFPRPRLIRRAYDQGGDKR